VRRLNFPPRRALRGAFVRRAKRARDEHRRAKPEKRRRLGRFEACGRGCGAVRSLLCLGNS